MTDHERREREGRDETPEEKADRNLNELLQELRVALPGVQVLFAFLLTVPFAQGFRRVTEFQEHTYFVTLLLSAVATGLLMAPTAYHRLNFRKRDKTHIVEVSSRLAILGMAVLAVAMTGAVVLVTDYLFRDTTIIITGVGVLSMFVVLWFVLPLLRRRGND